MWVGNVLLLRNNINLSLDAAEVSLQKLLSLVVERLIDSNSNVQVQRWNLSWCKYLCIYLFSSCIDLVVILCSSLQDKDDEYVKNQQQNISDAIDLLPRLATGIDVNLHFRKCVVTIANFDVLFSS